MTRSLRFAVMAMSSIAFAALSSAASAQVLRGSAPPPASAVPPTTAPAPSAAQMNTAFSAISGNLRVVPTTEVKNPAALSPAIIAVLQQQKQAADLEAGQTMSATGTPGAVGGISVAGRPSTSVTPPPTGATSSSSPMNALAKAPIMSCMAAISIIAVNQKKTGAVFTPNPTYNLYTITGCGFGSTAGKIYLQGGAGAFPAHNGKIALNKIRTWSEHLIVAEVDPTVTGELDQNNISLVVETSNGGRAQADGFSFYAARGPQFALGAIPRSAVCSTSITDMNGWCDPGVVRAGGALVTPCGTWGITDCGAEVFRQGPMVNQQMVQVDHYTPKLKPGFVLSAAVVLLGTIQSNNSTTTSNYLPKFSGNTVLVTEPIYAMPNNPAQLYSLYGIKLYVIGPAGITNALADGQ
jgi:hypothetical protein